MHRNILLACISIIPTSADAQAPLAQDTSALVSIFSDGLSPCRCKKPKPPNTHHCRICGKCVVDMDHHCPFLNNCVGRSNLKYFLLFLFWVTIAMVYALTMLVLSLLKHQDDFGRVRCSL
jgi:hypothetical protein